ncbi:hypothetical protein HTS88_12180 [Pseudarthrobacter oxydans]|uniref:hypothetical protein n=1 Tax=Pseudarthrobacter oxydans TaxID=1671 RepID=UPI001572A725|nr:hypothetical protein [Pseudarthrobacter oxydans]NSX37156.1 hypothetical protein [Pseudarthrobacter oxydans]
MTYDWFKERELERIGTSSDFRFAASLYLHAGTEPSDTRLEEALTYANTTDPRTISPHLRKEVFRLASGQRIIELTDPVLGADFADAVISYEAAGGSLAQDFSPAWAAGVIERILAGTRGIAHPQAA